jgi:hypothetical protein
MAPTDPPVREPGVSPGGDRPAPVGKHEASDVSTRAIVRFGIGLGVATVLVMVGMWGLFRWLKRHENRVDVPVSAMVSASLRRTPPEPRLEPNPLVPRQQLRARENATLTTAGWIDRANGVVRIPIDRAEELLVQRGLPPAKVPTPVPAPAVRKREKVNE